LGEFHKDLIARGIEVHKAVDHGISQGIYFSDPDHHCWEVFVERQRSEATRTNAMRAKEVMAESIDLKTLNA
jgi:catechol-2,3-dioxygenase